jgi:outer membrane protein OmpA-like peptidoglycan-associated protein
VATYTPPPSVPDDIVVEPEPPPPPPQPVWKPDELARVEEQQILIRDPIQFEVNTANILPESLPTLRAIAALLHDHGEIVHVVIEGHASEEGTYIHNYDLSVQRSLAIFRELVIAGVHPSRLSCRGMGEVVPVVNGTDEASLAINRRVIFHIVRRLLPGEPPPALGTEIKQPWSGDAEHIEAPPTPAPPAAPPAEPPQEEKKRKKDEKVDPNQFHDDDEGK